MHNDYTVMVRSSEPRLWKRGVVCEVEVGIKVGETWEDASYITLFGELLGVLTYPQY